jgi:non-homologous end joining protein Ku
LAERRRIRQQFSSAQRPGDGGNRLRQQMVDAETGRVLDKANKDRSHELGNGKYVELDAEDVDTRGRVRK